MIYYPKQYGLCNGSQRAVKSCIDTKNEFKDKNIIKMLKDNDIGSIDDLNNINDNDIIIIRAHGETKETYNYLNKNNIKYIDATCKNVLRVHKLVGEKYNEGYKIIIVGTKNHPEVIGTNSYCNNKATLIEKSSDLKNINKKDKYYLVAQTTTSNDLFNNTLNYLKEYNVEYTNTICNAQKLIQSSSCELAKNMDLMIVIGGSNSSNTKELYNEIKKVNNNTYIFSEIKEFETFIKKNKIKSNINIGLTGGASTPKEQINEFSAIIKES